ncbi:MAG: TonB-dependent receptor [Acidobacteria bacterium]|nr:TonB-dependent receptor [Acidobacteriota bacterium]
MTTRALSILIGLLLASVPAVAGSGPQLQAETLAPSAVLASGTEQAASQASPPAVAGAAASQAEQQKPKETKETKEKETEIPRYEEQVVVTASKVEQQLVNAPATISVISAQTLATKPAADYGGLFRSVAGVNVSQTSARDLNITSRGATGTLSTTQLALIDGRSVYMDFFGFVGWDFLPLSFNEVKQIEIVRGPASAVWGANAMTGVVNIITKSPREMQGTNVTMGVGSFDRSVEGETSKLSSGSSFYTNVSHARVINDRWSFKVSAGYLTQDPYARPVGNINDRDPSNPYPTPYPQFTNVGTSQPKFDGRVDYDFPDGKQRVTVSGGYGGTSGIIHTGIGPFQIQKGSAASYVKADYSRGPLRVKFFTNFLDGSAPALLAMGVDGKPISFSFNTKTYDFDVSNISTIGSHHVLSYGGNIRHNGFDLSIAPGGSNRNEQGFYVQDEMFLSAHFRWLLGGRLDHFDVLAHPVFSPRTTFMYKPADAHTFRVSYNKAYRAPSLVNNFLDTQILNQFPLARLNPAFGNKVYTFPLRAQGSPNLKEQSLTAYEIGYTGTINNRARVSFAWYYNDMRDEIFFMQNGSYSSANPPPGWPLPPVYLDALIAANAFGPDMGLPSHYTYLNLGRVKYTGIELGLDTVVNRYVNAYVNYSWQPDPKPDFSKKEINLAPHNRFNIGLNASGGRFLGDLAVSYQSDAFWQDVLDARYSGWTDAFTLVNGSFGVKWAGGKLLTSIKATNILNQQVQQHVFGDVIKRLVAAEIRVTF